MQNKYLTIQPSCILDPRYLVMLGFLTSHCAVWSHSKNNNVSVELQISSEEPFL